MCGQKFIHKAQYNTHLTCHTNVKPFACNHCKNAAYTTTAQLMQHVAMCMFGSPFRCEMCGKSFSSQTTMKQHHQNVHAKSADFPCDLCPKIYKQYASLCARFIRPVARVGSGDPVRVLRLYTTNTLDEVCSIYC